MKSDMHTYRRLNQPEDRHALIRFMENYSSLVNKINKKNSKYKNSDFYYSRPLLLHY